jgi:hypothetical protein
MESLIEIIRTGKNIEMFIDYFEKESEEKQKELLTGSLKDGMNVLHICSS